MAREKTLEIGVPDVEVDESSTTIGAPVRLGPVSARFRVELPFGAKAPPRVGDALLLWFLLPAMQRAERLHVGADVSPELLERIGRAQKIWASLPRFTGLRVIGVEAPVAAAADDGEGRPWAAFFPGSVDAAFTALRHRERLAFLTFAHGLDRQEIGAGERAATSTALREAARALDLPLVEVDTNYWAVAVGALGCDPAGASSAAPYGLAHLLAPHVGRLLVPGELDYREYRLAPELTTHDPLLDPWVGSDAVTIRVDGMAWGRAEKRSALQERPELLAALRACEQQDPRDRPEAPRRVDVGSADPRSAAREVLDRYSGRSELLRRTPWLLPALASSQIADLGKRKAFRNWLRRALGQEPKAPPPLKGHRFQPCPEPGASLFVPDPWIGQLPNGDWHYAFALWLRRRSGHDLLLQEISVSSSAAIDVSGIEGTPALSMTLPVAMRLGLPIEIGAPVSPAFREATDELQDVQSTWLDGHHRVSIEAPKPSSPPPAPGAGVASFFSLGVDSFDTLLAHRSRVTHLVFVHGFDIQSEKIAARLAVEDRVRCAADELGCELVVMQTDARKLTDDYVPWGEYGGVLAACAQLLTGVAHEVLVPASAGNGNFIPFATTPLTDHLYSTESIRVEHCGAERSRFEKVQALAEWDLALRHLRVCWHKPSDSLNCGTCDKCIRTITAFQILGALDRAPTLPALEPEAVARAPIKRPQFVYLEENLEAARARGLQGTPLLRALEERLARAVGPPLLAEWGRDALDRVRAALPARGRPRAPAPRSGRALDPSRSR